MAVITTMILGYPLALVFLDAGPRLQKVLIFVIVMPLLLSVVVRTFAWIVILGREGVINQALLGLGLVSEPLKLLQTELGLVISLTQIEMPLMLLPLISVMSRIDPNLRDAAAALGASRWRTLFTVIVAPLTAAPVASSTRPDIVAPTCPDATPSTTKKLAKAIAAVRIRLTGSLPIYGV